MNSLERLKRHLKRGNVYRRSDLGQWSTSVDRHLKQLTDDRALQKMSHGLYHFPKKTDFGLAPPDESTLVRAFLKDEDFLIFSFNDYNSLGVGTTQLYNKRMVYNHKRHGEFELGGRKFYFHIKPKFPKKLTPEYLLVDLVNNLDLLAEDCEVVLRNVKAKAREANQGNLKRIVTTFGGAKAKKFFLPILEDQTK